MEAPRKVFAPHFAESMKLEAEQFLKDVMEAVNQAPDGKWIEDSEEQVRERFAKFRIEVFERALQARIDAAEAAFSPSAVDTGRSCHAAGDQQTQTK